MNLLTKRLDSSHFCENLNCKRIHMFQQENFSLNPSRGCKVQPRHALLGYPFHNMAAHTEAMPTREGISANAHLALARGVL